jgi:heat shock protein HtpX
VPPTTSADDQRDTDDRQRFVTDTRAISMDLGRRVAMAFVGVVVTALYLVAAAGTLYGLLAVWNAQSDLLVVTVTIAVVVTLLAVVNYYVGTAQVLAGLGAVELPPDRAPVVHHLAGQLASRMELRRPQLLVADLEAPNAFALGGARDGVVVVDRSLFGLLSVREMRALLAHEFAHLESHDSLVQTTWLVVGRSVVSLLFLPLLPLVLVVTGVARGIAWLDGRPDQWTATPAGRLRVGLASLATVALFGFTLFTRSYSRRRELAADDRSVAVTGDPLALASALRKLQRAADPRWGLFSTLYVAPREDDLTRVLSTHPPLEARIERLVARGEPPETPRWRRIEIE